MSESECGDQIRHRGVVFTCRLTGAHHVHDDLKSTDGWEMKWLDSSLGRLAMETPEFKLSIQIENILKTHHKWKWRTVEHSCGSSSRPECRCGEWPWSEAHVTKVIMGVIEKEVSE